MNFLTKVAISTGIVVSGMSLNVANANAAAISGFGDPATVIAGGSVVDFETATVGSFSSQTFGNVTISGIGGALRVANDYPNQFNVSGLKYLDNNQGGTNGIRFDFGSAVNQFAFNFGAGNVAWTLQAFDAANNLLDTQTVFQADPNSNAGDYFGIAANGISYATLVGQGDWVLIDRVTTSNAQNVPEPATMLGSLVAFGFAANAKRKQKLAQSAAKNLDEVS